MSDINYRTSGTSTVALQHWKAARLCAVDQEYLCSDVVKMILCSSLIRFAPIHIFIIMHMYHTTAHYTPRIAGWIYRGPLDHGCGRNTAAGIYGEWIWGCAFLSDRTATE